MLIQWNVAQSLTSSYTLTFAEYIFKIPLSTISAHALY